MSVSVADEVRFKVATEDWEIEQVHRLNYQTFVDEIPQHQPNAEQRLVDAFHDQNTYIVAVRGARVVGMLALRGKRPFSLDKKIDDIDQYLPSGRIPCEVRLLATTADYRNGFIFRGLVDLTVKCALETGYDLVLISGTLRQTKLYQHLGFIPFGPVVGKGDALYQPMYLTREAIEQHHRAFPMVRNSRSLSRSEPISFLPGPVAHRPAVQAAFQQPAISHRCDEFIRDFQDVRRELCRIANAREVQLLMGTGSLANDAVAAELSLDARPGIVLSNGAFGDRLIDQAERFALPFRAHRAEWGRPFDRDELEAQLDAYPDVRWLWAVHGETSTGVLNDLEMLKEVTSRRGIDLCLDVVSSLGTTPVDLSGVRLASSVSGKGLGSYSGIAIVFQECGRKSASRALPRYFDLGFYGAQDGIPFTFSSNLLYALKASLDDFQGAEQFHRTAQLSSRLRDGLRALGLRLFGDDAVFPAVTTFELPPDRDSMRIGKRLENMGYLLHYRSGYLRERNWMQICTMSRFSLDTIDDLLESLGEVLA